MGYNVISTTRKILDQGTPELCGEPNFKNAGIQSCCRNALKSPEPETKDSVQTKDVKNGVKVCNKICLSRVQRG